MTLEAGFFLLTDLLLKGAAVMVVAGTVAWLLRRSSAANQNAVWAAAILVLLLLPVTFAISPRWAWFTSQPQQAKVQLQLPHSLVMDGSPGTQSAPSAAGFFDSASTRLPSLISFLLATWVAGFLFFLVRRLAGSYQLWKLKRQSISPPPRLLELARAIEQAYQIRRAANIRLSEPRTVPLTWGTLRPVIILPVEAVEWNEELLRIVLRHEYAHIRRHDACFRLVAQLVFALHWPNLLVWSAVRKLRVVQEQAADDLVLQTGVDPVKYADELVSSARRFLQPTSVPEQALAMAQLSTLGTRVNAVLDNGRDRRPLSPALLLGSIAATLLILAGSALAQVTATSASSPTSDQKEVDSTTSSAQSPASSQSAKAPAEPASRNGAPEVPQPAPPDSTPLLRPTPSATAEADRLATQRAEFGKHPIEINAESTRFENGIAVAEGAAKLKYLNVKITADSIHYSPGTRTAIAKGNVELTAENGNSITGVDAIVEYNLETTRTKVSGPHQTRIKDQKESK